MKMIDYPDRINISPVFRQKREDDFYLVDRSAFPDKGTEYVRADLHAALEAQLAEAKAALKEAEAALILVVMEGDELDNFGELSPKCISAWRTVRATLAKLEQNENGT